MNRKESIGSTMMVLQEQLNHQKRLDHIYSRSKTSYCLTPNHSSNYSQLHNRYSRKDRYQDEQHLRTIKKLFESLNRGKTMADRYKDPHDFYAYPALFFRETLTKTSKTNKKQQQKKKGKTVIHINQESEKFSQQKIRQFLPILTNFQQSDFQQFTDGISKMIISFNITTRQDLSLLQQRVTNLLPKRCPADFLEAIDEMFREIDEQMLE